MANVLRVALPGYDALTDTNLDHYSLYTDADNILIKEFTRGSTTFSTASQTIAHNLGYVPDFKAYVNDTVGTNTGWKSIAAQQSAFVAADYYAEADTSNFYLYNNTGGNLTFAYYIFYDNQVGSSTSTLSENDYVLKIAKSGQSAFSLDPNNYIYHSDLNTFKILKEATASITYTADGEYTISHGLSLSNPAAFDLFLTFPDGYTVKGAGVNAVYSRDQNFDVYDVIITSTQIKFHLERLGGAGTAITAKYYIYESPLTGSSGISITQANHLIRVAKSGYNALTETDPNNYAYLSGYNTLKYSTNGNTSITIVGDGTLKSTEVTVAHGLSYTPYFDVFVDDFVNYPAAHFSHAPFYLETLTTLRKSEVYADATNIYLKMFNQSLNTYTGKFYYKIYKNNLSA